LAEGAPARILGYTKKAKPTTNTVPEEEEEEEEDTYRDEL
jgi:hypothetical protein